MIAKIMMKMIVILMFIFLVIEVQTFQFQNYYLKHPSSILSLTNNRDHHHHYHHSSTRLPMMAKNKFKRSDFEGKDIFSEDDDDLPDDPAFSSAKRKANKKNNNSNPSDASNTDNKKKVKLEPETVFFEGPPSASEVIFPAISVLTVIGIVPFISAVTRQFWVKYKFTSRRISIRSGFQGNTQTDVIYSDINEIKFVYRLFGAAGDMVLFLKDGAKVELRHVPKFEEIYNYVISKCDSECQEKSMKLKTNSNNASANGNNSNSNAEAVNR